MKIDWKVAANVDYGLKKVRNCNTPFCNIGGGIELYQEKCAQKLFYMKNITCYGKQQVNKQNSYHI